MKLNPDCMRDVLFAVEAAPLGAHITERELSAWLPQWSKDDIIYSCIQLGKAQYLEVEEKHYIRSCGVEVHDLTPQGHLALSNIRTDTVWNKAKTIALKAGKAGIVALVDIAKDIVASGMIG